MKRNVTPVKNYTFLFFVSYYFEFQPTPSGWNDFIFFIEREHHVKERS